MSAPACGGRSSIAGIFLNGALLAGILIIVNLVAYRHGTHGFDLTREQTYSLSSLTLNQVETLKNPLTFYMVYGRGTRAARQLDRVAQLLEMYRSANPAMIKLETLNPYTELARAEDIAKRAPDLAVLQGGGVLIESGEGTGAEFVVVPGQEMFEPVAANRNPENADRFESVFKGEDAITSALIRLRDDRKSKVGIHHRPRRIARSPTSIPQGRGSASGGRAWPRSAARRSS